MKVLLIHYRYYEASGPERYLFNITKVLQDRGHEVIPFSLDYPQNKKNKYSGFFPKPVLESFHVNQQKDSISLVNKLRVIRDGFYNKEVSSKLHDLIKFIEPDVSYVLQYGTKLSTSIFDVLFKNGIPIILRVSDFNIVCAKNIFYRDGSVCTKCIQNKRHSVFHKCVHGSFLQSLTYFSIQKFNEFRHFEKKIKVIITPSKFTYDLLKNTKQFKNNRFIHIPTFANIDPVKKLLYTKIKDELRLCYVGRVADDKGIHILIMAMKAMEGEGKNVLLDIYGDYQSDYGRAQIQLTQRLGLKNVCFKGFVPGNSVNEIYPQYHFSVIPSKWFDNMPNSLIESCMNGVPVIVSRIGSLEELVKDGLNGYTFEANSHQNLTKVIKSIYNLGDNEYVSLSRNTRAWVENFCNKEIHYQKLLNVFKDVIHEKNS